MMRLTSRPAILPASLVAWRWSSLKYAGTVITALSTVSPRYASASVFSFWRIIALISGGEYCLPPASTRASPFGPLTTLNGTIVSSSFTSACLRPMKRLIEKTVFSGLVTAWRFATVPTRRSPPCVKATTDGVVRAPSAFSITVGSPPSRIAMHEFVVPRSIPIVFAMSLFLPGFGSVEPLNSKSDRKSERDYGRLLAGRQRARRPVFGRGSALGKGPRRPQPRGDLDGEDRNHDQRRAAPGDGGQAVARDGPAEEAGERRLRGEDERGARGRQVALGVGLDEEADRAREHRRHDQGGPDPAAAGHRE